MGIYPYKRFVKVWRDKNLTKSEQKLKEAGLLLPIAVGDVSDPLNSATTNEKLQNILKELKDFNPQIIRGYVSPLYSIAQLVEKENIKFDSLESVVTSAEYLPQNMWEYFEKVFKCPVYNLYGGTESSIIAHECEVQAKGEHKLHIQEDRLIVEMNENNEIIFTDLTSKALPFIRYKNGDIGIINENYRCECGRNFKVFNYIEGRVNEMFILLSGGKISSHLWQNYMKKCEGIERYQMIQNRDYSVDILWVKNDKLFKLEEFVYVQDLILKALEGCEVKWNEVIKINVTTGGKFRQHICKVKK